MTVTSPCPPQQRRRQGPQHQPPPCHHSGAGQRATAVRRTENSPHSSPPPATRLRCRGRGGGTEQTGIPITKPDSSAKHSMRYQLWNDDLKHVTWLHEGRRRLTCSSHMVRRRRSPCWYSFTDCRSCTKHASRPSISDAKGGEQSDGRAPTLRIEARARSRAASDTVVAPDRWTPSNHCAASSGLSP
jgi:hypothetical protein